MGDGCFRESQVQFRLKVLATEGRMPGSGRAAKKRLEEIRKLSAAELLTRPRAGRTETAETSGAEPTGAEPTATGSKSAGARAESAPLSAARLLRLLERFRVLPVLPVLIVFLSFVGIAQYFIRLIDLLEPAVRLLVVGIKVRMVLPREFTICRLDLILSGRLANTQYFVVIDKLHGCPVLMAKVMRWHSFLTSCRNDRS